LDNSRIPASQQSVKICVKRQEVIWIGMNVQRESIGWSLSADKDSVLENVLPFYRGIHRDYLCVRGSYVPIAL